MSQILSKYNVLAAILIFLCVAAQGQPRKLLFDHLNSDEGLGSSTVHCIAQDLDGFMWFGTSGGVFRYDGYQMKGFFNDPKNDRSIRDNRVNSILVGSDKTIYIGTWDRGISVYDPKTESFDNYFLGSKKFPINGNQVKCLFEDSKKNIWMGLAEDGGLNLLDKKTRQFINYRMPGDNRCMAIAEDKNGLLWICGYDTGLTTFDLKTKKFNRITIPNPSYAKIDGWAKRMRFDDAGRLWIVTSGSGMYCFDIRNNTIKHWGLNEKGFECVNVWDIWQEAPGLMWVATDGNGLALMDVQKESFTFYRNKSNDPASINTNAIYSLYKDNTNILWIGTFDGGINIYNPNKLKFPCYRPVFEDESSLSNKSVLCVVQDREQNLWIGTDGGGLNLYNDKKYGDKFIHFKSDPKKTDQTAPDVIKTIYQDSKGHIWLGTWGRGIVQFDPQTLKFDYSYNTKWGIATGGVWAIQEDHHGDLWISILGNGLKKIDHQTGKEKIYRPETNCGLYNPVILCFLKDRKNRFWTGSEGSGIFLYQDANDKFKNYSNKPSDPNSIGGNIIRTMFEDSKGRIWIGTLGHGLCLYNEASDNFTNFNENDGLISNSINSIQEDLHGNLWLATNKGLVKFNPDTKNVKAYDRFDGLQGNDFNYNACTLTSDGGIAFGGLNGMNIFHPEKITDNAYQPPVFITGISIFNIPVQMNDETNILSHSILETKEITLTHKQSVVTFTFSALNFTHPQKNGYAYMLEKFETKWNYVGNKREATYTNLDPGEYIFRVKACNNDGVWNEKGASLKIIILPPFWKTWWFRTISFLFIVSGSLGFLLLRIRSLERQKMQLEEKVEIRTKELKESNYLLQERQDEIMQQAEELQQQAEELTAQRDALTMQNKKISEQNNHITASVRYAQTLQKAILPSLEPIEKHLECFTIYQPKDIVSGDFYWYANLNGDELDVDQRPDRYLLSVIDCTGHGVPGAFMTLIADRLMYEAAIEHQIQDPAAILEELDKGIQAILKQNTTTNRDGMDLVVCLFEHQDDQSVMITFAGSKNPLFYYEKASHQIVKVEADRRYIGMISTKSEQSKFTNKRIHLKKGDVAFLCTDGYIDQSNDERKRLGTKLFMQYLLEFAHLPVDQLKMELESKLKEWQGEQMQRDDISLIGIRI